MQLDQPGFQVWWKAPSDCKPDGFSSAPFLRSVVRTRGKSESLSRASTDLCKQFKERKFGGLSHTVFSRLTKDSDARRPERHFYLSDWAGKAFRIFNLRCSIYDDSVMVEKYNPDKLTIPSLLDIQTVANELFTKYRTTCSSRTVNELIQHHLSVDCMGKRIPGLSSWFIPPEYLDEFKEIRDQVHAASGTANDGECPFSWVEFKISSSALGHMQSEVSKELNEEIKVAMEDVNNSDLTTDEGKAKAQLLNDLQAKLKRYQELFNQGAKACQEGMSKIDTTAVVSQLAARPASPVDGLFNVS